jgi:DHA3 family multidrug efflux protein-like MFS transporter
MKNFYLLIANTFLTNIVNMTVWFALTFYIYLQTKSVLATSIISGIYLVTVAVTGFWFGSLVDHNKKKPLLLITSIISFVIFTIGFFIYTNVDHSVFSNINNPILWIFVVLQMFGVLVGNVRGIALPTLVTVLVQEQDRDKANGMLGTVFGVGFLIVSVISGILVGHSGMYLVLLLASIFSLISIIHLLTIDVPETEIAHVEGGKSKIDIPGTIKVLKGIPGLLTLILFSTFNNFLGGVFMSLMDAYGLSLVSVQTWGLIWGFLSTAFIVGGIYISKKGLGGNPLKSLFIANIALWIISSLFTIQPSIILLMIGMFLYLAIVPFIEASEHTIMQKVVPVERQGRVFGFAQSVEQSASPLTAFLIGPLTQFIFIPLMTDGVGANLIGSWFGTGPDRGMALVFTVTGIIGLIVTILAMRSRFYKQLEGEYLKTN